MTSLPPKSDADNEPEQIPTDFQSLISSGVLDGPRERPVEATDFASLRKGMADGIPDIQHNSITDYLVDFLTPVMIFVMTASFVFFLLDVRYVYTDQADFWLRWVAFFLLIGIVALNRLIARDGRAESILYLIALTASIGLYTVGTSRSVGSVARNFADDPWLATFFNMGLVALLWWATNRLTHECCVDENPSAGEIGLLTGTALRIRQAIDSEARAAAPKLEKLPMIITNDLTPYDPSEWQKPEKKGPPPALESTRRLPRRHPGISILYFSIPAMLVFAGGQRVLENGGDAMVRNGQYFIVIYTVAALLLLMLSSLGGLRGYFRERNVRIPAGIGPFWIGLGVIMVAMVVCGAHWLPAPGRAQAVYVADSTIERDAEEAREKELHSLMRQRPPAEAIEQMRARHRAEAEAPMALPDASGVVSTVGMAVVICMGLLALYAALRGLGAVALRLSRRWGLLGRFFAALDKLLQRLMRLPTFPRIQRRVQVSRDVALSVKYLNPFADERMTPPDILEFSYSALCALAEDLGVPRRPDQTPYEYIGSFPEALASLREDAINLTSLYVLSAYGNVEMTEKNLDIVRRFWRAYSQVRNAVIR